MIRIMNALYRGDRNSAATGVMLWSNLPANTRGMLLMAMFAGVVSLGHVIARHLSQDFHPMQAAFFRTIVPLVILTPILMRQGPGWWRTTRPGLQLLRGLVGGISMLTWFYALALIPVGDATALSFTVVIFASMGAVIILRPGADGLSVGALVVLVSSLFWAAALLTVKVLARTDSSITIVFYSSIYFTILAGIPAAYYWRTPDLEQFALFVSVGLLATVAQLAMTGALKIAETTAIMPMDFTRLLWAAGLGYIWFGEFPDLWTWTGGAIVFASTIYITYRENRAAKVDQGGRPANGPPH